MGSKRYIIVVDSLSSHCCFGYTIVDTKDGKEDYGDFWTHIVCETFDEEDAVLICEALNKGENNGNIQE